MAATPQPILFYSPVWTVNDLIGQPNVGGFINFYDSANPTVRKAVYKDSNLTNPWDNPIEFDVTGAQDNNFPIYGTDDGPYRIIITDDLGTPIKTFDPFPYADSGAPVVPDQEISNMVENGQFNYWYKQTYQPVPASIDPLLPLGWSFTKNNTSATDVVSFVQFNLGQTDVPAYPKYSFNYTATGAGSAETEKYLQKSWDDVGIFSNTEMTLTFQAKSSTLSTLELNFLQNFGTGGTPSASVESIIGSQVLTTDWALYSFTITVQNVSGKVLGTSGDDFCALQFNFPLNLTCNINITNVGFYFGDQAPEYQFQSPDKENSLTSAAQFPVIQNSVPNTADGNYDVILEMGNTTFSYIARAGQIVGWGTNTAPSYALLCNGLPYYSKDYYNLANYLYSSTLLPWSYGPQGFTASLATATITATCVTNGTVTSGTAGNTPFTYTQTNNGGAMAQGVATILVTAASTVTAGMYFLINTPSTSYYVWLSLNNKTNDPIDTVVALAGKKGIKVVYTGSETDVQLATLIMTQLEIAHFRVPDLRGLFERMPNFNASAVLPSYGTITLTSTGNLTAINFTIVGLDVNGAPVAPEVLAGPNNNTVTSVNSYSAITSITPSGAVGTEVSIGVTSPADTDGIGLLQTTSGATALILDGIYSRDPNYSTRYAMYTGGATGDNVGSQQENQNRKHFHIQQGLGTPKAVATGPDGDCPTFGADPTQDSGGHQANPNNVYVNKIIYF